METQREPLIEFKGVSKQYGDTPALGGGELEAPAPPGRQNHQQRQRRR